ncbi:hypothetical protein N7449_007214 [Penicillium cf. viridicatum]|uniref:Uncharacterized protein n=1 Tax=Penicillium cf. viridicatum TaxID=2972119 RepID=A0A9W9MBW0_9EURO|nr:hypothetical protein N7449_007214 [Penicillium cf. viridicatum]
MLKNKSVVFHKLTAFYKKTKPLTRAVKRFGGHINNIQRTMIIDADMPEEIWPYAVDTAIYINNRLVNLKTKISPLTH